MKVQFNPRYLAVAAVFLTAVLAFLPVTTPAEAQTRAPIVQAIEVDEPGGQILSFRHLGGSTVVEMKGTRIEPRASAKMKIESRPGFVEIDINRGDIKGLQLARRFGKDFLTYVLWAVSVDGEAVNLGEITFEGETPVSINVTAPYQTFWLMMTAEPDFAVNDPSPVAVLYSVNQDSTVTSNKALPVSGKLLYYTYYTEYDTSPAAVELGVPNEVQQARKAIELAQKTGILAVPTPAGEEPLPDEVRTRETLEQARNYLRSADEIMRAEGANRDAIQFARTAAQVAENARALSEGAVGGIQLRQLERELSKAESRAASLATQLAERDREVADLRTRLQQQEQSSADRLQQLEAALDQERQAASQARGRAEEAERTVAALRGQLAALEQSFDAAARQNQLENARLREERDKVCSELRRQLNSLGQLTEQGGNMVLTLASDILFDFDRYELRAGARENLAKLTVLRQLLFPASDVHYEGHTDRVGEDDYNQWLSEQRALAVYRYFLEEQLRLESDAGVRSTIQERLATVEQLLAMSYPAARRNASERSKLLAGLGGTVWGKGEREPVEDTAGPSERNRRVVLLIPPVEMGQASTLCEAPARAEAEAR